MLYLDYSNIDKNTSILDVLLNLHKKNDVGITVISFTVSIINGPINRSPFVLYSFAFYWLYGISDFLT